MLLFLVRGDPAFSMLQPVHERLWQARGGMPVTEPWQEVEFVEQSGCAEEFVAVDCLTINTGADGFLVSPYARDVLAPLLSEAGQFWPVRVLGQPYWWLNCIAVVTALDRQKTDADWSKVEGDWGSFSWISTTRRLEFRPSQLRGAPSLFRIPEYPQGILFALDTFRRAVEIHDLTGFRFDPVWSRADGGVPDPVGISFRGMFDPASTDDMARRRHDAREKLQQRHKKKGN